MQTEAVFENIADRIRPNAWYQNCHLTILDGLVLPEIITNKRLSNRITYSIKTNPPFKTHRKP